MSNYWAVVGQKKLTVYYTVCFYTFYFRINKSILMEYGQQLRFIVISNCCLSLINQVLGKSPTLVTSYMECFSSVTLQGSVQLDSINQNNWMFYWNVYWMFIYFIIEYINLRNWNKTNPSLGLASVCMESHLLFNCRRLFYSKVFFAHYVY